ncbi:beta-ketoacyl synthase N-terminal-like domain-containing protein [Amycolatopsis minnesotensis]|uniref:Type I polyketide synthase n=1 Tax=Amycolatopsis minnesotensis TaxID=337894 RepID=A0ABN2S8Q8_9PSEU
MVSAREPVAIVGMAVWLPGAPDLDSYRRNLFSGVDAIADVPESLKLSGFHDSGHAASERADPARTYCHRGGFLDRPLTVDSTAFGVMPSSVPGMEPDQLVALKVAADAVEDAGGRTALGDTAKTAVILGRGAYLTPALMRFEQRVRGVGQILRTIGEVLPSVTGSELDRLRAALLEPLGAADPEASIGLVPNLAASRVANRLDLGGPAYTVDAACASSLIAVDHAMTELAGGRCDAVLAGGVHHCHDETLWSLFTQLRALSPSERISPLSQHADGLLIGEGTGVVVLKRLADAQRDGDRIYAVVRGTGTSSDGRAASLFNPDTRGQELALRRAWAEAGLDPLAPHALGLLEAHGTATPAGDAAELDTIGRVFGPRSGADAAVVGSVKSMIGHTMPAAGVAGLVKAALALHHTTLPPTLHCEEPNPLLAETAFTAIGTAREWDAPPDGTPRRAAVNAFGFGGINAHTILEEHSRPSRAPAAVREPERTVRLGAATPGELGTLLDRPGGALRAEAPAAVGACRLSVVDPTDRKLELARRIVAKGEPWRGRNDVWFAPDPLLLAEPSAKTAFVFPGIEAEFVSRCADVAAHFGLTPPPAVRPGSLLSHVDGLYAVGGTLDFALRRLGIVPDGFAGHSVGEWTAMTAAGMYRIDEAKALYSRYLPGGFEPPEADFVVLGCPAAEAERRVADEPGLVVSHDNAPRQSIACGPPDAVARLAERCRADGVVARILPFRSGFHTPLLRPLLSSFEELITGLALKPPSVPIWSATTADRYPDDLDRVRALYLEHLVAPVRFRELVESMYADGFRVFLQAGPGQLGSFVADTLDGRAHLMVSADVPGRDGMAQLRRVAAALWTDGGTPRFEALETTRSGATTTIDTFAVPMSVTAAARGLLDHPHDPELPALPPGTAAEVVTEFTALLAETRRAAASVVAAANGAAAEVLLDVSLDTMPYLRDHRFFRQRADWPDEEDHRPVVPATALIDLAVGEVVRRWPDEVAVAVHHAVFTRWLVAAPAQRVPLRMRREGDRVRVEIGEYASMTVELGRSYPVPPEPRTVDAPERTPPTNAVETYERRHMFHGPGYQGLSALHALGARHIRGELMVPPAPGGLLDSLGQLLGCWLMASESDGLLAFPRSAKEVRFHGPHPAVGERLDCLVEVTEVTEDRLAMSAQLVHRGRIWASVEAWRDVRFTCDHRAHRVYAFPDRNLLSTPDRHGWMVLRAAWRTAAARDLYAGIYLGSGERADYDRCPPPQRQRWLTDRIAVKDAVRAFLAERGTAGIYPAEVVVTVTDGVAVARGWHGAAVPEVTVDLDRDGDTVRARAGDRTGASKTDYERGARL